MKIKSKIFADCKNVDLIVLWPGFNLEMPQIFKTKT